MSENDLPEEPPPVTEDIGLATPLSPGRLPPPHLPPAPDQAPINSDGDRSDG